MFCVVIVYVLHWWFTGLSLCVFAVAGVCVDCAEREHQPRHDPPHHWHLICTGRRNCSPQLHHLYCKYPMERYSLVLGGETAHLNFTIFIVNTPLYWEGNFSSEQLLKNHF